MKIGEYSDFEVVQLLRGIYNVDPDFDSPYTWEKLLFAVMRHIEGRSMSANALNLLKANTFEEWSRCSRRDTIYALTAARHLLWTLLP